MEWLPIMFTIYGKHVGQPRWLVACRMVACRFGKKDKKWHPKRVFNPCRGKIHEPKSVPESESFAGSASTSDNDSEKKKRKFLLQWLKIYSWLKYDEDKNFMYCDFCTKFKRKNSLHRRHI